MLTEARSAYGQRSHAFDDTGSVFHGIGSRAYAVTQTTPEVSAETPPKRRAKRAKINAVRAAFKG